MLPPGQGRGPPAFLAAPEVVIIDIVSSETAKK